MDHKPDPSIPEPKDKIERFEQMAQRLLRIGRAQSATVRRVEDRLEELYLWAQIKADKTWKLYRQTWEEWAEPYLGYSYKTIDNALEAREAIGEPLLRLLIEFDAQKQQVRALCQAVRRGGLQIEGTVIRDGATVIDAAKNVQGVIEYVERLHTTTEAKKQEAKLARQEVKGKDEELAAVREAGKKLMANQQELIERQKGELDRIKARPVPIHGATEADRQQFPHLHTIAIEIDLDLDRLEGLTLEEGHATGFWRELGNRIRQIHDRVHDVASRLSGEHPEAFDSIWDEVRLGAALPPGERPEPVQLAEQAERMLIDAAIPHNHDA